MRTIAQVADWCTGAAEAFGDPSASVGQVFARYVEATLLDDTDDVAASFAAEPRALQLRLLPGLPPVELPIAEDAVFSAEGLEAFAIRRVAAGVWHLYPSLNVPGLIHVFVVLYGVPEPAPWDRRIVLPAGVLP